MHRINLDASRWTTPGDLYDDLLPAVGAPDWHGRHLDALWDGLTGGLWSVRTPITVEVANSGGSALMRSGFRGEVAALFAQARDEGGLDCAFTLR